MAVQTQTVQNPVAVVALRLGWRQKSSGSFQTQRAVGHMLVAVGYTLAAVGYMLAAVGYTLAAVCQIPGPAGRILVPVRTQKAARMQGSAQRLNSGSAH